MQYTARVEIHDRNYDQLHSAMALESFSRILTGANDRKQYHMPIGEYWTESSGDAWAVIAAAKRAALSVDANANIVVSGGGQIVFFNCKQVVPERSLGSLLTPPAPRSKPSVFASMAPPPSTLNVSESLLTATPPAPAPSNLNLLASLVRPLSDKR